MATGRTPGRISGKSKIAQMVPKTMKAKRARTLPVGRPSGWRTGGVAGEGATVAIMYLALNGQLRHMCWEQALEVIVYPLSLCVFPR